MATYETGDTNADEIVLIQRALHLATDGRFTRAMAAAVAAWQAANNQPADGAVGPDMLLALGLHPLLILERGDTGALVHALQARLGVTGDDDFGKSTLAAVKAWQQQAGQKADGRVRQAMLQQLGMLRDPPASQQPTSPQLATPLATPQREAPRSPATATPKPSVAATSAALKRFNPGSWAYQLVDIDPAAIAALAVDLAVVDYASDGAGENAFAPAAVARMRQRPDGGTKRVVAYLSIGEAEDYRYYWQKAWTKPATRPSWLDAENPEWAGNYKVRYWDPAWQAIIFGSPAAYLDRIIAAGFDGAYLDIVDGFEYWRDKKRERSSAARDMIAFVKKLAAYARAQKPGFLVIPQNGEELLADAGYRAVISAQAKEDLFFGEQGDGTPNATADVAECLGYLAYATRDGLPILVVEYLDNTLSIAEASTRLASAGCCPYFGPRNLAMIPPGTLRAITAP